MNLLAIPTLARVLHPADWRTSANTLGSTRMEVCPPAYFLDAQPIWLLWAQAQWQKWNGSRTKRGFLSAQTDVTEALRDLQSYEASCIRENVQSSHSLLDLWYLRPAVFQVIARHRGETEALTRMTLINRHFHVRMG